MSKRQRTTAVSYTSLPVQARAKRPIDKNLVNVNVTVTDSTQTSVDLYSADFPGTMTGLRWTVSAINLLNTNAYRIYWAIVVSGDGVGATTMTTSSAGKFYVPERNCLAFGCSYIEPRDASRGPAIVNFEGSTKTMRKFSNGDKLHFIALSDGTNAVGVTGIVQFFMKT